MITEQQREAAREAAKAPSNIQREIDELGWRDVARELRAMGYVPSTPVYPGEFEARDDRDGRGPYVAAWYSSDPFPLEPELLRPPETPEARAARLEALLVNKPYIHAVQFTATTPADGPSVLQYAIVLANHVVNMEGRLEKQLSNPLSLAQVLALGFTEEQVNAFVPAASLQQVDEVMALQAATLEELNAANAELQSLRAKVAAQEAPVEEQSQGFNLFKPSTWLG